jgi:hypothetical protein
MATLPTSERTAFPDYENFAFCNSPILLDIQNAAKDTTIKSVRVFLWIWHGDLKKVLGSPNHTMEKDQVSVNDNYIQLQIDGLVKSFLVAPTTAQNTDQPNFAYNELTNPAITGQGVFYQIQKEVTSDAGTVITNEPTHFATLGYLWNYEQTENFEFDGTGGGASGFKRTVNRFYNPQIHNYIEQSFNLEADPNVITTENMINVTDITPPAAFSRCSRDSSFIAYIDKLGLFQMFTPHGKITTLGQITGDSVPLAFRNASKIDNTYTHHKTRVNTEINQKYIVNTGYITEDMTDIVEEIMYSDKVYLIKFKGDVQTETTVGITVDNTFITVDDTTITVDEASIGAEFLSFFKTHRQIPVTIANREFLLKTMINDKIKIDYNIELEETSNKINNTR